MKISSGLKHYLNEISKRYHETIPLTEIFNACKINMLFPIQEDGSEWEGFVCGESGNVSIKLEDMNTGKKIRKCLQIQWYKMQSCKYEVNVYIL